MTARTKAAIAAALMLASSSALADKVDVSTLSCNEFVASAASDKKDDVYGASAILYWLAGYLSTDDQGSVVDFDNLLESFKAITEQCGETPAVSVLSVGKEHLGENAEENSSKAIDLSLIKCEQAIKPSDDEGEGLGQILMWMTGHNASDDASPIIDLDRFGEDSKEIGAYCAANPGTGLYTAAEKFMGDDAE